MDALAAELGLLGEIQRDVLPDQRAVFTLSTQEGVDDIIAICSFILDPQDLKITEEAVIKGVHQSIDDRSRNEEEQGYGFFEPLHSTIAENAQGYGFFAPFVPLPLPDANSKDASEQDEEKSNALAVDEVHTAATAMDKKPAAKRDADKTNISAESSSIRVGIEKVDQLINLVGELVITQAMIEPVSYTHLRAHET